MNKDSRAREPRTSIPLCAEHSESPSAQWKSPAHRGLLERAYRYARQSDVTILIEGESGTGKTLLARQLHDASPRAKAPFHQLSLASIEDSLASSELFGHVEGAYTGARHKRAGAFRFANTGTLFLDEIGKASLSVQRKLLIAIESKMISPVGSDQPIKADVRLIAATNVPLSELRNSGQMLPDLVPRLTSFTVRIPPLRDRREDINDLVFAMIRRHAVQLGLHEVPSVSEALLRAFRRADWPHNLRELDATILRLLVDAEGAPTLGLEHCLDDLSYLQRLGTAARDVSAHQVRAVANDHRPRAVVAKELGISPATLYRRLLVSAPSQGETVEQEIESVNQPFDTLNGTQDRLGRVL